MKTYTVELTATATFSVYADSEEEAKRVAQQEVDSLDWNIVQSEVV